MAMRVSLGFVEKWALRVIVGPTVAEQGLMGRLCAVP